MCTVWLFVMIMRVQFTLAHQSKQDVEQLLVSENVQRVAGFGVDDRQTMDLMIDQHLHSIIEAGGKGERGNTS